LTAIFVSIRGALQQNEVDGPIKAKMELGECLNKRVSVLDQYVDPKKRRSEEHAS
jgi:hypothetical protein